MELKCFSVQVNGLAPILMSNPVGMTNRSTGKGLSRKVIPTPEEEAETGAYRLPTNQLYIPAVAFRGAILNASMGYRIGKEPARIRLSAGIIIDQDRFPIFRSNGNGLDPVRDYAIDTRRAVVQRQGILRSRAMVELPWECTVAFSYDADIVTDVLIADALKRAGQIIGILDYRPACKGWFGRFEVEGAQVQVEEA